ncbi:hypothetical protein [Streptomyces sp. NEAU-H3]|uniref:hypothetical protein n=1 Tax=Streptomyces sp. NEAU-H3 TaxID=2720636 RepID=UPI00143BE1BC|nr:hypothetical protein [Streptomyces sp. NEAU-H3]NJA60981.1 hypothetical protein [Streptomyces sp. NEAU-H3]
MSRGSWTSPRRTRADASPLRPGAAPHPRPHAASRTADAAHLTYSTRPPDVTAAVIGPRTPDQLDGLLAGAGLAPDGEILDRIRAVVPRGTDLGPLGVSYVPPALRRAEPRRRPADTRAAA